MLNQIIHNHTQYKGMQYGLNTFKDFCSGSTT